MLLQEKMTEMLAEAQVATDDLWYSAARTLGFTENFIDLIGREKRYKAAVDHWHSYQTWLAERNPERAAIEAKYGYDTKHGMHLMRCLDEAREILTECKLSVRRPNAAYLIEVRNGALTIGEMLAFAERENAALNELVKTSKLPDEPDYAKLDALCVRLVEASFR